MQILRRNAHVAMRNVCALDLNLILFAQSAITVRYKLLFMTVFIPFAAAIHFHITPQAISTGWG